MVIYTINGVMKKRPIATVLVSYEIKIRFDTNRLH